MEQDGLTLSKNAALAFLLTCLIHGMIAGYGIQTGFGEKEFGGALKRLMDLSLAFYLIESLFGISAIIFGLKSVRAHRRVLFWVVPIALFLVGLPILLYGFILSVAV